MARYAIEKAPDGTIRLVVDSKEEAMEMFRALGGVTTEKPRLPRPKTERVRNIKTADRPDTDEETVAQMLGALAGAADGLASNVFAKAGGLGGGRALGSFMATIHRCVDEVGMSLPNVLTTRKTRKGTIYLPANQIRLAVRRLRGEEPPADEIERTFGG